MSAAPNLLQASLRELGAALAAKQVSSVELAQFFMDRIKRLNPTLNFIATELHKGTSPLFKKPSDEAREATHKLLQNRWGLFSQKLGDKPYVLGDFSVADAYAFTVLRWARGFKVDLSAYPKLEDYFQRVQARPAVQQALTEEGLPTS